MKEALFYNHFESLIASGALVQAKAFLDKHTEELPPEERSAPYSVGLRFKASIETEVADDAVEAAIGIPALNWLSGRLRRSNYRSTVGSSDFSGIRVVSEGDSWFQYPVRLEDIIDNVMAQPNVAVYSLGAAGDTVERMAERAEFVRAILREQPQAFLLSAGGNDLLGDGQLVTVLKPYQSGMSAQDVINTDALDHRLNQILDHYRKIVKSALEAKPDLMVFGHGYDYPKPLEGGRWLGAPLSQKNIPHDVGEAALKLVLTRFNAELADLTNEFNGKYTYLNLLGQVGDSANSWHDELHPKDAGFGRVSQPFIEVLERLQDLHESARLASVFEGAGPAVAANLEQADDVGLSEATNVLLTDQLRNRNAALRRRDGQLATRRPGRMRDEEEMELAWEDIEALLDEINEPDTAERRATRDNYSIGTGLEFDERIINENDLDEYNSLERGVSAGRAVGKVMIRMPDGRKGSGSGFIVGPGLFITNNHVLATEHMASNSEVLFNYHIDALGVPVTPIRFRFTDDVFLTDKELDYTFASLGPVGHDGTPLEAFGILSLLPRSGKALKVERVSIIQHPRGEHKKVALRDNFVLGVARDFMYYVTDTQRGSSGSPVFNTDWQVAALHHRTVPDRNDRTKFLANRGVRISSILRHVAARRSEGEGSAEEADRLIAEGRRIDQRSNDGTDAPSRTPDGDTAAADDLAADGGGVVTSYSDTVLGDGPYAGLTVRDAIASLATRWQGDEDSDGDEWIAVHDSDEIYEAAVDWTSEAARESISDRAFKLIIEHETGGPSYYNNVLRQAPTWPGGRSGVTIGVGYDLGYKTRSEFRRDWSAHLRPEHLARLERTIGVKGRPAKRLARALRDIRIPLDTAGTVFAERTLPKSVATVYGHLPNEALDALHGHCVGALVSLVLNRGASFRRTGQRYREMREILKLMEVHSFAGIPAQLRSMKRIWRGAGVDGLLRRRDDEAELFEAGLAAIGSETESLEEVASISISTTTEEDFIDAFAEEPDPSVWEAEAAAGETAQPYLEGFLESSMPRYQASDALWVNSHTNNPDTWHLPADTADNPFELTPEVIEGLIRVGRYEPVTLGHGNLIISLRGCRMLDARYELENESYIRLAVATPDHQSFRCLIGVYDTQARRISLYLGSTVPRGGGMLRYYNWKNHNGPKNWANLLPTGCYEHCVGTHVSASSGNPKWPDVLRLGHGPTSREAGAATVLRTHNDLIYGTQDLWHCLKPKDNIHPAFYNDTFSSIGCLTIRGSQRANTSYRTATKQWAAFQTAAGIKGNHGTRYDNLLTTGHEAATVAKVLRDNGGLDQITCLRHGSNDDLVRGLQRQLGTTVDGEFGPKTKDELAKLQNARLGFATGTWTRAMADHLGLEFDEG